MRVLRRDFSKTLLASTAGAALLEQPAQAQSCNASCYPRTQAEVAASVTPMDNSHAPGSVLRYGADSTGASDCAASFRAAISQWVRGGSPPRAPAGLYRIDSTISILSTASAAFTLGIVLLRDGDRT